MMFECAGMSAECAAVRRNAPECAVLNALECAAVRPSAPECTTLRRNATGWVAEEKFFTTEHTESTEKKGFWPWMIAGEYRFRGGGFDCQRTAKERLGRSLAL